MLGFHFRVVVFARFSPSSCWFCGRYNWFSTSVRFAHAALVRKLKRKSSWKRQPSLRHGDRDWQRQAWRQVDDTHRCLLDSRCRPSDHWGLDRHRHTQAPCRFNLTNTRLTANQVKPEVYVLAGWTFANWGAAACCGSTKNVHTQLLKQDHV